MATDTGQRLQSPQQALERFRELLSEQAELLSPQVREALAWSALESEATPRCWEAARELAAAPEPEPEGEDDEPREFRAERDSTPVTVRRNGGVNRSLAVPARWTGDYPLDQQFLRERLTDGSIIFRPIELTRTEGTRAHKRPLGTHDRRLNHMTPAQARRVKELIALGKTRGEVEAMLNLTTKQVAQIARGKTWKDA